MGRGNVRISADIKLNGPERNPEPFPPQDWPNNLLGTAKETLLSVAPSETGQYA
jgi:hypothetical protein